METKVYSTINRAKENWPSGLWDGEPDKKQWQDKETGLPCLAVRHTHSGHWCGYVGVSESHPLFGKDYESPNVDVHGGLTFADRCQPGKDESQGVCHLPEPGESDHVWWFGFDCAHCNDYSPRDAMYAKEKGGIFRISPETKYRSLMYVERECASLAKQLTDMLILSEAGSNS